MTRHNSGIKRKIVKYFLIILTCMIVLPVTIQSQQFPQEPISAIIIMGNDQTDEEVIRRELLFSEGDVINDSILIQSHKRLMNLWLFNRVEFKPIPGEDKVALLIMITERWYIFPYPRIQIEDRDWSKISYGFGFAHENFRGMNEKLYATILFGERPGYRFNYRNPWFGRNLHLLFGINLNKFLMNNHLLNFEEDHLDINFYLGKYWSREFYTILGFSRDQISVGDDFAVYMQTQSNRDINYGIRFSVTHDTRDLYAYPSQGHVAQFWVSKQGFFVPEIDYWKYQLELKKYYTWRKLTFAARVTTLQSIGSLPIYDLVYFGFGERIRGHFYEVFTGKHFAAGNLELRYPIIDLKYFTFRPDLLPDFFTTNLKFGLNAAIFTDTGIIWKNRDELRLHNFISGWGFGLHFIVPYIEVFRIETAFNENWDSQFIFEVRTAF